MSRGNTNNYQAVFASSAKITGCCELHLSALGTQVLRPDSTALEFSSEELLWTLLGRSRLPEKCERDCFDRPQLDILSTDIADSEET